MSSGVGVAMRVSTLKAVAHLSIMKWSVEHTSKIKLAAGSDPTKGRTLKKIFLKTREITNINWCLFF